MFAPEYLFRNHMPEIEYIDIIGTHNFTDSNHT